MSLTEAISSCFRQYVGFSGRAPRSEFWYFQLFAILLSIGASIIDPTAVVGALISLALFLPSLAVSARRLHDTNRSGWWMLIALIPLVGIIVLIVWWASAGDAHANRFGPAPFGRSPEASSSGSATAEGAESARVNCPRCGESIAASARVCRYCGLEFPEVEPLASDPR